MKHRCQCGKPGKTSITRFVGNTLHFKVADRQCERCGAPICLDCTYNVALVEETGEILGCHCRSCAELEEI